MFDREDASARERREEERDGAERDARPHHMVVSDGELLDIGPDAEPIEDSPANADERLRRATDAAPRYGRRATDRTPSTPDAT